MAILKTLTEFNGSIGNMSAYTRKDSDKVILRFKGGANKSKIKRHKSFEKTRQLNMEWGGCSRASAQIRNLLNGYQHITDYNIASSLTGLAKMIQGRDAEHPHGERSILFSQHASLLEGFQFNRKTALESVVRQPIDVEVNHADRKVILQVPELVPGINFHPNTQYPLFRIIVVLGSLMDLHCFKNGYAPIDTKNFHQVATAYDTPWLYTAEIQAALQIDLSFPAKDNMHPDDRLLLAFGIEYGTPVTDQLVKQARYVGAGKLMKTI